MSDSRYKRDLEKLFKSGGDVPERFKELMSGLKDGADADPERAEAVQALRDAGDFRTFVAAVRDYRKVGHELPNDEDLLVRMFDVPDERTLQAVLAHILDLHRRRGFDRTAPIRNRLTTLRSLAEDPKTVTLLDQIAEIV